MPPLWDARFEHASCGLGALVRLDGRPTHELVQRATRALRGLEHRGATGADPDTGDGAGIMVQLPDRFLRRECEALFGGLTELGGYGTGLVFLPRDSALRLRCEELCVRVCAEEGHRALGFRDVPWTPAPSAIWPDRASRWCGSCSWSAARGVTMSSSASCT